MKKIVGILLMVVAVSLASCKTNDVNVVGVYQGQLPCADCDGINFKLTLNEDKTFEMESTYLGKGDGVPLVDKGAYKIENNQVHLLNEDMSFKYAIGEGYLEQLDIDGNKVVSELNYKLTKQ